MSGNVFLSLIINLWFEVKLSLILVNVLVGVKILLGIPHMSDKFYQSSLNPLIWTVFCWVAICIGMGPCHENFGKSGKQFHFIDRIMVGWMNQGEKHSNWQPCQQVYWRAANVWSNFAKIDCKYTWSAVQNNHERIVTGVFLIQIIIIVFKKLANLYKMKWD